MASEQVKQIFHPNLPKGLTLRVCRGIGEKIERGPMFFSEHPSEKIGWRKQGYATSDVVIEILNGSRVVAGLAYNYTGGRYGVVMDSHGTYVSRRRRGQGLASILWKTAIEEDKVKRVDVQVISDLGMTLINSLEKQFPEIHWHVTEGGGRDLRKLKKKKTARRRS